MSRLRSEGRDTFDVSGLVVEVETEWLIAASTGAGSRHYGACGSVKGPIRHLPGPGRRHAAVIMEPLRPRVKWPSGSAAFVTVGFAGY